MILTLLLTAVFLFIMLRYDNQNKFRSTPSLDLIKNYSSTPKTIPQKIHIVISLTPNTNKIITNILSQTERSDLMSIIVPEQYETQIKNGKDELCKLVKETCVVQISGGYAMIAKERENGTILVYVKGLFEDPNALKRMLTTINNDIRGIKKDVFNFNDAVCVRNCIKIGVDDVYKSINY